MRKFCLTVLLFSFSLHAQTADTWRKTVSFQCPGSETMALIETAPAEDGPWIYQDQTRARYASSECEITKESAPTRILHRSAPKVEPTQVTQPIQAPVTPVSTTTPSDSGTLFVSFVLLILLIIAYIFPSAVASHRHCKATAGIVIVNLSLGWTFVGWVVALAWAASGDTLPGAPQAAETAHQEKIVPARDMREPWFPPVRK
jgi:Superinfection immunity protein